MPHNVYPIARIDGDDGNGRTSIRAAAGAWKLSAHSLLLSINALCEFRIHFYIYVYSIIAYVHQYHIHNVTHAFCMVLCLPENSSRMLIPFDWTWGIRDCASTIPPPPPTRTAVSWDFLGNSASSCVIAIDSRLHVATRVVLDKHDTFGACIYRVHICIYRVVMYMLFPRRGA